MAVKIRIGERTDTQHASSLLNGVNYTKFSGVDVCMKVFSKRVNVFINYFFGYLHIERGIERGTV